MELLQMEEERKSTAIHSEWRNISFLNIVLIIMDISVCINIETNAVTLLQTKRPRKQKLGVAIFFFRKK